MHPKASADSGNMDDLLHKFRPFLFQFREFINHQHKMGHGLTDFPVLIPADIGVYLSDSVFPEHGLAPVQFTFQGNQGPVYLTAGQVGNLSLHMGKPGKQICHTAALVINNKKA